MRNLILQYLSVPRTLQEIAKFIRMGEQGVEYLLEGMRKDGLVDRVGKVWRASSEPGEGLDIGENTIVIHGRHRVYEDGTREEPWGNGKKE